MASKDKISQELVFEEQRFKRHRYESVFLDHSCGCYIPKMKELGEAAGAEPREEEL